MNEHCTTRIGCHKTPKSVAFGGGCCTTLNQVERYWRAARLTKIFEGTSDIQMRIILDHIRGRD